MAASGEGLHGVVDLRVVAGELRRDLRRSLKRTRRQRLCVSLVGDDE